MAREFNLSTQKLEFLKECHRKEILTRVIWRRQYGYNLPRFTNTRHKISMQKIKDDFKLPAITETVVHGSMDKKIPERIHENSQSPKDENTIVGDETKCFTDTVMRPVSPKTRNLLYSGTSKEEQGRYGYMKVRNNLKPEHKYIYPFISSWDYGWKIGNVANRDNSLYGHYCIVSDVFFRKNGIPCQLHPKDVAM